MPWPKSETSTSEYETGNIFETEDAGGSDRENFSKPKHLSTIYYTLLLYTRHKSITFTISDFSTAQKLNAYEVPIYMLKKERGDV